MTCLQLQKQTVIPTKRQNIYDKKKKKKPYKTTEAKKKKNQAF